MTLLRDNHQITLLIGEHVTRIQRIQNGSMMKLVGNATVVILLAEEVNEHSDHSVFEL